MLKCKKKKFFNTYSIRTEQNVSYTSIAVRKSHSTMSRTLSQFAKSASEGESSTNHSNFGPAYEMVILGEGEMVETISVHQ